MLLKQGRHTYEEYSYLYYNGNKYGGSKDITYMNNKFYLVFSQLNGRGHGYQYTTQSRSYIIKGKQYGIDALFNKYTTFYK